MLASKKIVHKLIPQEKPMIMVDSLIHNEALKTITGFYIDRGNLFSENGKFTAEGLIENMAQSAALRTGWIAMQGHVPDQDFTPPVGVIGAVKNFKLHALPRIETTITTEIRIEAEIMNATIVKGRVMQDDKVLAEGELKIFLQT